MRHENDPYERIKQKTGYSLLEILGMSREDFYFWKIRKLVVGGIISEEQFKWLELMRNKKGQAELSDQAKDALEVFGGHIL